MRFIVLSVFFLVIKIRKRNSNMDISFLSSKNYFLYNVEMLQKSLYFLLKPFRQRVKCFYNKSGTLLFSYKVTHKPIKSLGWYSRRVLDLARS